MLGFHPIGGGALGEGPAEAEVVVVEERRGGASYLTQEELRKLREDRDKRERLERQVEELIEVSVRSAYERLLEPQLPKSKPVYEDEEEELIIFLVLNL